MSKIRNTSELLKRANFHARHDRIKQGTYGSIKTNGKVEYEGCAIACLSVPSSQKGLRDYFDRMQRKAQRSLYWNKPMIYDRESRSWDVSADQHRDDLKREFGIGERLVYELEWIFEELPTHGAAIEFIPDFAKALRKVEGVTIREDDVPRFRDTGLTAAGQAESLFAWLKAVGKAGGAGKRKLGGTWDIYEMRVA